MADDGHLSVLGPTPFGRGGYVLHVHTTRATYLAAIASQMGAVHKLDLTSDVTHLIVGDTDTPKYKYVAKERPDVKCLLPEWIDAVRESWMEGGETDVETLELVFELPTFSGLRVCVTGFDDVVVRKRMEETVKKNGGEYRGDLSKEVTHLIAHKPTGNKYTFARTWGIRVVSIEWLYQSLERGMILDESLYDPLIAPSERGQNAWVRRSVSSSSLGKRLRDEDHVPFPARKLRRTASARVSSQNDTIWSDIVGGGVVPGEPKRNEWDEYPDGKAVKALHQLEPALPERTDLSDADMNRVSKTMNEIIPKPQESAVMDSDRKRHGLFYGRKFFLHGFDSRKTDVLEHHLRSQDAEILSDISHFPPELALDSESPAFLIIPHTSSEHDLPSTPDPIPQSAVVTDMWIERCLHQRRFVQPNANITNSPFRYPVPGFENMTICCTAFEGIDLLQASKVIKLMGATYDEFLTENVSVLICNNSSLSREKIRHALDWGVPAVEAGWLWDCLRAGRRKAFDRYLIHPDKQVIGDRGTIKTTSNPPLKSKNSRQLDLEIPDTATTPAKPSNLVRKPRREGIKPFTRHPSTTSEVPEETPTGGSFRTCLDDATEDSLPPDESTANPSSPLDPLPEKKDKPEPLQELSTNSPPKPPPSQAKIFYSAVPRPTRADKELSTAISSLLAHHKREQTNGPPPPPSESIRLGRRKRQLFGRALSNISTCSAGSASFSRASSVDTMNTDGVGTPLEPVNPTTTKIDAKEADNAEKDALTASLLASYDDMEYTAEKEPPMTQLGYEDPEAGAWRARLMSKLGGGGKSGVKGKGATVQKRGVGTVQDAGGVGSVSRRTRQGVAR